MTQNERNIALVCALSEWIEQHLGRDIYLDELARYSGYSLWHMQKIFRETTGMSLGRYIRERKLSGAAKRLRHTEAVSYTHLDVYKRQAVWRVLQRLIGPPPMHPENSLTAELIPQYLIIKKCITKKCS